MENQNKPDVNAVLKKLDQKAHAAKKAGSVFTALALLSILAAVILITFLFLNQIPNTPVNTNSANQEIKEAEELAEERTKLADTLREEKAQLQEKILDIKEIQNSNLSAPEKNEQITEILVNSNAATISPSPKPSPTGKPANQNTAVNANAVVRPSRTPVKPVAPELAGISKIYIQIVDNSQRKGAEEVARSLRGEGLSVPGIEWVKGVGAKLPRTVVRYFHPADKALAEALILRLRKLNVGDVEASYTKLPAEKGQLEIWFSGNALK